MLIRVSVLIPVLMLCAGAKAEVVYLSCSGTTDNLVKPSAEIDEKVGPIPMAVDLEKGTVSFGGYSPFPILNDGRQNLISFAGHSVDEIGVVTGT